MQHQPLISDHDLARLKSALQLPAGSRGRGFVADELLALSLVSRADNAELQIDFLNEEQAKERSNAWHHGFWIGCTVTLLVSALTIFLSSAARADDIRFHPSPAQFEQAVRVAWGEMRGGSDMEVAAVCHVMLNRMLIRHRGTADLQAVAQAPRQFSAYNVDDVNRAKLLRPKLTSTRSYKRVAAICATSIRGRLEGWIDDITHGADHYWNGRDPWWIKAARGKLKITRIGTTNFVTLCRSKRKTNLRRDVDQIGALIRNLERTP